MIREAVSVTCLCCGASYERECPNLHRSPHSTELAVAVARRLLANGMTAPTKQELKEAIAAEGQ